MAGWDGIEEFDDAGLDDRLELIKHLEWMLGPPFTRRFIDQIAEAIELAAAGDADASIELDREYRRVSELVEYWALAELVERAKAGGFRPRRGEESWRREPPTEVASDGSG